jgi:hypothetical protein
MVSQNRFLAPDLYDSVGFGQPASAPPLDEIWATWHTVRHAADEFLYALTTADLQVLMEREGKPMRQSIGTPLLRDMYHRW